MNAYIKKLWTADLDTTTAPQAQLALFDGVGYCCLGRLCELHRQETGEGEWTKYSDGWYYEANNNNVPGTSTALPRAVIRWAGLSEEDPVIGEYKASYYNDTLKKTFKEISALIKKNVVEQVA